MSQRWSNLLVWVGTILFVVLVSKAAWAGNEVTASSLLRVLIFALPIAGIYAMSATGLVVVYTTTGIFNFAQGAIGMFFAFLYWQLTAGNQGAWHLPSWIAFPLVVLVLAPLAGVALDRGIMRHLQGQSLVVQLMVTVGLLFAIIGLVNMLWNQDIGRIVNPFFGTSHGWQIHSLFGVIKLNEPILLTWGRIITIISAIVLAIGLRIFLFRTRTGIAMRAVVDNRDLAALTGARAAWLSSFSWALGCSIAALAGILLAPETGGLASGGALTLLVISSFAAAVVGRLRSLPMVYVGALILALAQQYAQSFLQFAGRWTNVKDNALPTIMLFIVLLLLPRAGLQFARVGKAKHPEHVSTVRDTVLGMALLFAVMAVIVQFLHGNNLTAFINGMCIAIVALSLVPLIGWAGQVSLAGLAFAGIGATVYARLGGTHGSPLAILLAGLICMPIGALLAFPALRLQGLYLALMTMAFASLVQFVFFSQPFAIGTDNRTVERLNLFGVHFNSDKSFFLLVVAVFAILAIGVVALRRSAFGRRLIALRDSEAASATVGINILETKLVVFALSAGIAGIAGAFLAMDYQTVSPTGQNFEMLTGLPVVLALVIGGVACVSGALFAGLFSLGLVLIQSNWHLSLWADITSLAPGLAVLSVIQSPSGAVVKIGESFAPYLPWRADARRDAAELKAATAEAEVGELGVERPFTEADVLLVDRALGISNDIPRVPVAGA